MTSRVPTLLLGTALWGWTINQDQAFHLLDAFYRAGYRWVDSATNYPIDKVPDHFKLAQNWLAEWCESRGVRDLRVMMKIGSMDNSGSPHNNLEPSFLLLSAEHYRYLFGENLACLMFHWDNRNDRQAIRDSLEAMHSIKKEQGVAIGFSGLKYPTLHADYCQEQELQPFIQIKHNLLKSAWPHYAPFHGRATLIAYGINAGGLKLKSSREEYRSAKVRNIDPQAHEDLLEQLQQKIEQWQKTGWAVTNLNHLGMIHAFYQPGVGGILIGPSKMEHLQDSIDFHEKLLGQSYEPLYQALTELAPRLK